MTFRPGGNVGIGTISPVSKLDVQGTTTSSRFNSDTTNIETVSGTYSPTKMVYQFNEGRGWGYNRADDAIYYAANTSVPVVFRGNGKVGIGTTNPEARLHINGAGNSELIRMGSIGNIGTINGGYPVFGSNAYSFGDTANFKNMEGNNLVGMGVISPMRSPGSSNVGGVWVAPGNATSNTTVAWSNMLPALTWNTSGNIGMGTTNPTAKLDVIGDIHVGGASGINQHRGDYIASSGIREIFRLSSHALTTSGTFSLSATRSGFVHSSQWAWSTTHNSTGRGTLTQLSSGDYGNLTLYLDVTGNGSAIISADWGSSQAYSLSIYKTSGTAIDLSNNDTDWSTVNSSYTRQKIVSSISDGIQAHNAVFNGNVGIGTSSPSSLLSIGTDLGPISGNKSLSLGDSGTNNLQFFMGNDDDNFGNLYWDGLNDDLHFRTKSGGSLNADQLVLDSAGNVGVGTSSPTEKFHTQGNGLFRSQDTKLKVQDTNHSTGLAEIQVGQSDWYGSLRYDTSTDVFSIDTYNNGAATGSGGIHIRHTNGNVGIGTESASYTLHVNGSVAGNSAYVNTSDERFKMNINPISISGKSALDKVLSLNGVYFDWRNNEFPDRHFQEGRDLGVIAQNVQEVFPEAVTTGDDGYLSVAYAKLVAPLIEAVKELFAEDQKQNREIASLKEKNEKLEKENDQMKNFLCQKYSDADFCSSK